MIRTASIVCLLMAVPTAAQVQKVTPPKTVYWMSAATQSGFGFSSGAAPSASDIMKMAMGGGTGSPIRMLELDLGSSLPVQGTPSASHAIPPGMGMGAALPLLTPRREASTPSSTEPPDFEQPKGRLLLFWGCGEAARPGQPVVIDFSKVAAGQVPPGLFAGEQVRIARPPSAANWATHGEWPNQDRAAPQSVPSGAALVGAHRVTGTYTPEIAFSLQQDWMPGLTLQQTKAPSGAVMLGWNSVAGATAHFAQMMGGSSSDGGRTPTIVFWSSSDTQTFVSGMSDYIAPAEAARLVTRKQLMPASQTSCAIPKEAVAAAEGAIVSLVAHGPEVNIVHPPRPSDPKIPWVQEWAVKARFVSRTGGIAGMDMPMAASGRTGQSGEADTRSGKPKCPTRPASATEAVAGAVLGGMFGRRKPPPTDCVE